MYSYHIKNMAKIIIKALVFRDKRLQTEDIIEKALKGYWTDQVAIVWTIKDIMDIAKKMNKKISKRTARLILNEIFHKHDASLGVNWNIIEIAIRDFKG